MSPRFWPAIFGPIVCGLIYLKLNWINPNSCLCALWERKKEIDKYTACNMCSRAYTSFAQCDKQRHTIAPCESTPNTHRASTTKFIASSATTLSAELNQSEKRLPSVWCACACVNYLRSGKAVPARVDRFFSRKRALVTQ